MPRLSYTTTPRQDKSLFNGLSFYDPSVAELLATSVFTIVWVVFLYVTRYCAVEVAYVLVDCSEQLDKPLAQG
jgi:hypothetical protein